MPAGAARVATAGCGGAAVGDVRSAMGSPGAVGATADAVSPPEAAASAAEDEAAVDEAAGAPASAVWQLEVATMSAGS